MAFVGGGGFVCLGNAAGQHSAASRAMNLANPHFAEPHWLWLAALGPSVLLALQRYSAWARRRHLARLASPEFVGQLTLSQSPWRRLTKEIMLLLAVAGIGLALARPQWGEEAETSHL